MLDQEEESLFDDPSINDLDEETEEIEGDEKRVTNCDLVKDPRLVFACLCGALSYFQDTQLEPTFSPRLDDFGLSVLQVGLMFTIVPITYIPAMMIVQVFPKWVARRFTMMIACMLLGIATFFNGPSLILGMPDKLYLIVTGQALSGIAMAFLIIPVLPEMMAAANKKMKGRQKQRVNTLTSGLFNASLGIG